MQLDKREFYDPIEIKEEQQRFMTQVYGWMFIALSLTGLVAYYVASTPWMTEILFGNPYAIWILFGAVLLLVVYLSRAIQKMSAFAATSLFFIYSALMGIMLSSVFIVYTQASIASTFFVTAVTFGVMSAYGYFTKTDLTKLGNILLMALVGLIIASVVNFFMHSEMLYWIITYVGVLIFVGLTAYDTQKIKKMNIIGNEGTEEDKKEAIMGALTLYLDFINLFLFLLRIMGNRK